MTSIIVCNTGADCLSKIDLKTYSVSNIKYTMCSKPIGPHSIRKSGDKIITANSYNDSVSIFTEKEMREVSNIKVGKSPADCILLGNNLYTVCADLNSVIIQDVIENEVLYAIKTGGWPRSIDYSSFTKYIYVSNMEEDSVDIIDSKTQVIIQKLKVPEYPTKVKVSLNQRYIYICESYLGSDNSGYLDIFELENHKQVARIKLSGSPMDVYEDENNLYTANFTDGSITTIDKKTLIALDTIYIGGMPKSIVSKENYIYVVDYLKGRVVQIENGNKKNIITVGTEPNAMILI